MEAGEAVALAAALEALAALAAAAAAARLWRAAGAVADKALRLAAAGLALYSLGLSLEAAGALAFHAGPPPPRGARPEEVAVLLVNRGTLLSMPVYTVSYALLASSVYVGHVPLERRTRLHAAAPVIVGVYANYNLVSLAALLVAAYYTLAGYGRPSPANTAFYALAAASHAAGALAAVSPHWQLIAASMALRGAAVLAFHLLATRGSQG